MAKTNNYYWWTPEKWRQKLYDREMYFTADTVYIKMLRMTHHERRLYIRHLLLNNDIKRVIGNVSPDSSL